MLSAKDPKEFEPGEKQLMDAMLGVWENDLYREACEKSRHSVSDTSGWPRTAINDILAAHNLILVTPTTPAKTQEAA